jgi:hypothetical protein
VGAVLRDVGCCFFFLVSPWPVGQFAIKLCERLNQTRKGSDRADNLPSAKALGFFELRKWRLRWGD